MRTRSGAAGEARREAGQERVVGLVPGNLVRRPYPLPSASKRSSCSSLDDDEKRAGRFDEGRGPFCRTPRSSMGHDAAGAAAAFPPATFSFATNFPAPNAESSVRVGFVEGERERLSPVHETASAVVTALRLITCEVMGWSRVRARQHAIAPR